jgi:hypothetical protein
MPFCNAFAIWSSATDDILLVVFFCIRTPHAHCCR